MGAQETNYLLFFFFGAGCSAGSTVVFGVGVGVFASAKVSHAF
jgi:hypothetical protein